MSEPVWRIDAPLHTARLELRVHRRSDLDDLMVFHSDPVVTRYIPWPVRTREQVQTALETKLTQDVAAAVGNWIVLAIVLRDTPTVIGEVLLKRADETGTLAEVGYVIRADQQGKGLASEAVAGILDFARGLGVTSVVAMVVAGNESSVKLLTRRGFERDSSLDEVEHGEQVEGFRLGL